MPGHIFLSYVHEDAPAVQRLAALLQNRGLTVWLDRKSLEPGDRWRNSIRQAIRDGDLFLACFSQAYTQRSRTHMNEELTLAIEELRVRPTDRAWFVPVILAGGDVPDRAVSASETLRDLQWVNLDEDWNEGVERIIAVALRHSRDLPATQSPQPPTTRRQSVAERQYMIRDDWADPVRLRLVYAFHVGASFRRHVTHQEIRIRLSVVNDSSVAAIAPHIQILAPTAFTIEPIGIASRNVDATLRLVTETSQPSAATLIGNSMCVIRSHASFQCVELVATMKGNMPVPECQILFATAAAGADTFEGRLRIYDFEIAAILHRPIQPFEVPYIKPYSPAGR